MKNDASHAGLWLLCLLVTNAFSGCAPRQHKAGNFLYSFKGELKSVESRLGWGESAEVPFPSGHRLPAEDAPSCLKDRLKLSEVKQEIAVSERLRGGSPQNFVMGGLDFSKLPAPQGSLVQFDGRKYLPPNGTVNFAGCTHVACVYNRVYGIDDDSIEGYLVYWWFLDMGYVLGANKEIPGVSLEGAQGGLRDFLFKSENLYLYWRLSKALPPAYRRLRTLQSFHRLMDGMLLQSWGQSTCGDAGGSRTGGYIRLNDRCVRTSTNGPHADPEFSDFGYLGITHEIGHRLDVSLSGDGGGWYLSEDSQKGFATLSGWREIRETSGGAVSSKWESGWELTSQSGTPIWSKSGKGDGFVRDYAGTSPAEDFADTTAYFRFEPELTREKSPLKFAWISDKFYQGRKFDIESRRDNYRAQVRVALERNIQAIVDQCLTAPTTGIAEAGAGAAEWSASLGVAASIPGETGADSVRCIAALSHREMGRKIAEFRATEFEACDDINSESEPGIRRDVLAAVEKQIPDLLARNAALAPIVKAQKEMRLRLVRELDPREAFLKCRKNEVPADCYNQSVKAGFDRIALSYSALLGEVALGSEWDAYRTQWAFDQARTKFVGAWERLTDGIRSEVQAGAVDRWASCSGQSYPARSIHPLLERSEASSLISPLLEPFSGGSQYIDLRLLECLNAGGRERLWQLLLANLARVGVASVSPEAEAFLREEVLNPSWNGVLQENVREAALESNGRNQTRIPLLTAKLSQDLLSDAASWVGSLTEPTGIKDLCLTQAEARSGILDAEFDAFDVRFFEFSRIRRDVLGLACAKAMIDPTLTSIVAENARRERVARQAEWDSVLRDLKVRLKTSGEVLARSCVSRNPGSRTLQAVRRRRRDCVKGDWNAQVAEPSVAAWLATDAVKKLPFAQTEASKWLLSNESVLQTSVYEFMDRL